MGDRCCIEIKTDTESWTKPGAGGGEGDVEYKGKSVKDEPKRMCTFGRLE